MKEELENMKRNQSEMKNILTEMKNTLLGINSIVDETEDEIKDLKDKKAKNTNWNSKKNPKTVG